MMLKLNAYVTVKGDENEVRNQSKSKDLAQGQWAFLEFTKTFFITRVNDHGM